MNNLLENKKFKLLIRSLLEIILMVISVFILTFMILFIVVIANTLINRSNDSVLSKIMNINFYKIFIGSFIANIIVFTGIFFIFLVFGFFSNNYDKCLIYYSYILKKYSAFIALFIFSIFIISYMDIEQFTVIITIFTMMQISYMLSKILQNNINLVVDKIKLKFFNQ